MLSVIFFLLLQQLCEIAARLPLKLEFAINSIYKLLAECNKMQSF